MHGGAPGPAMDMVFEIQRRAEASQRSVAQEAETWCAREVGAKGAHYGFRVTASTGCAIRAQTCSPAQRIRSSPRETRNFTATPKLLKRLSYALLKRTSRTSTCRPTSSSIHALVLHGVGLDAQLFSCVFALARVGGWTAHVLRAAQRRRADPPEFALQRRAGTGLPADVNLLCRVICSLFEETSSVGRCRPLLN